MTPGDGRRGAGDAAAGRNGKPTSGNHSTKIHHLDEAQVTRRDPRNGRIEWFQWWITELAGRTAALSPAALGAYCRLLSKYISGQRPLLDEPRTLARLAGVSRRAWGDIRDELDDVFNLVDGRLIDPYAEKCIAKFKAASARNRRNAEARYAPTDPPIEDAK